ncbi:BnaA07g36750D [Brassica napus]|uniref:(rape) hypothetical protein n=1 Tax=Brassica napus TaxID=3708 RepID=A0A078IKM9_BRANA|nr:unnamed protein product [Brassica napus]CDY51590.1 BnaA07g36750D [Brassica napus]
MASGAGNSFSRRRWTSASSLLISVTLCFMFHCAICLLPVRFLWLFGGRRSRQMLRGRQEFRNLRRAATRGPIPSFGPSSSDELRGFSRRRKALVPSTHSSIVLNSLSSSVEDLSCLAYIYVVVYAYCLRGWLIPSFYCSEED